jgi:hypothetical protein
VTTERQSPRLPTKREARFFLPGLPGFFLRRSNRPATLLNEASAPVPNDPVDGPSPWKRPQDEPPGAVFLLRCAFRVTAAGPPRCYLFVVRGGPLYFTGGEKRRPRHPHFLGLTGIRTSPARSPLGASSFSARTTTQPHGFFAKPPHWRKQVVAPKSRQFDF